MSFRNERVEKIIERELATILLMEAKNKLLKFISVTKVSLTADLSIANVWFTVLGDEEETKATIKALEEAKGYLRSELAKRLALRKTPDLRFKFDESLTYGNKISKILDDINQK